MECLEKFEDILEKESSSSQQMLRMLLFASQTKVIQKILPSIKIIIDNKNATLISICILIMFYRQEKEPLQ